MKTLFVTGGCGFIGSNFIRYMLNKHKDIKIVNLDKLSYASNKKNVTNIDTRRYTLYKCDLSWEINIQDLITTLCEFEPYAIVHFAAETHVDRSIENPKVFIDNNIYGTVNLLESIKKSRIETKFLHVSTDEVYGSLPLSKDPDNKDSWIESDPYEPNSPYAASKAASDHFVRAYGQTYNIPYIITNCGNNYGPYQFIEKFIPKIITNLLTNKKIPVYGRGINLRDWVYVNDHCSAIDLLLNQGVVGEKYNIGGPGPLLSNIEIVKKILNLLGKDEQNIEFVSDRPGHDLKYHVETYKLRELGWEPKVNLDEGLKNTVDWYKNNRWFWEGKVNENVRYYSGGR